MAINLVNKFGQFYIFGLQDGQNLQLTINETNGNVLIGEIIAKGYKKLTPPQISGTSCSIVCDLVLGKNDANDGNRFYLHLIAQSVGGHTRSDIEINFNDNQGIEYRNIGTNGKKTNAPIKIYGDFDEVKNNFEYNIFIDFSL